MERTADGDFGPCGAPVGITREDMFCVNDEGVVVDPGPGQVRLDAEFDVENARKSAQAILECCDRLDGAR